MRLPSINDEAKHIIKHYQKIAKLKGLIRKNEKPPLLRMTQIEGNTN